MTHLIARLATAGLLIAFCLSHGAFAQRVTVGGGRVTVVGECSYSVAIPRGWTASPIGEEPDGFEVGFARGGSYRISTMMLAIGVDGRTGGLTVDEAMMDHDENAIVQRGRPIRTLGGDVAQVQYMNFPDDPLWGVAAFIQCDRKVITIVLSSTRRQDLSRSLATWRRLVRSFTLEHTQSQSGVI